MESLIQWDLATLEWDGLCSHNPIGAGTHGAEQLKMSAKEVAAMVERQEKERKRMHRERTRAKRAQRDRGRKGRTES